MSKGRDLALTREQINGIMILSDTLVAQALRQAREAAGLSVSALARNAETSRAAVHAYENGSREPSIATALRLLGACGCTLGIIPAQQSAPARQASG